MSSQYNVQAPVVPEYNINGDSANGQTGSQTSGAVLNRASQTPNTNSNQNPYMGVVQALPPRVRATSIALAPPPPAAAVPPQTGTTTPAPVTPPQSATTTTPSPYDAVLSQLNGGAQSQSAAPPGAVAQTSSVTPQAQTTTLTPQQDKVRAVTPPTNSTVAWATEHAKNPGWEWLAQRPDVAQEYFDFAYGNGATNLEFADWLSATHPEIWNTMSDAGKASYKKNGYDSYFYDAQGNARPWTGDKTIYGGVDPSETIAQAAQRYISSAPGFYKDGIDQTAVANSIDEYRSYAISNQIQGLDYTDWLAHVHPEMLGNSPQLYTKRNGVDTYLYDPTQPLSTNGPQYTWQYQARNLQQQQPPTGGNGGGGAGGGGGGAGGGTGPVILPSHPIVPTTGGNGGGGAGGGGGGTGGGTGGGGGTGAGPALPPGGGALDVINQERGMLEPGFQWQQDQLRRQMNAQGALTGDINAEGFNEQESRAQTQLIGQQGAQLNEGIKDALDRALQKYGIDTNAGVQMHQIDSQKAIAEMQDATTRFNITNTTDLQKYLDSADNALKKYGIDQNVFMEQLKATAGINAAQIQAGAQITSAQISAAVSQAAIEQRRQEADNNFQIQLGQLGLDKYKWDNPSFNALLAAYLQFTPEQIANMGLNPNLFPGYIYGKNP